MISQEYRLIKNRGKKYQATRKAVFDIINYVYSKYRNKVTSDNNNQTMKDVKKIHVNSQYDHE